MAEMTDKAELVEHEVTNREDEDEEGTRHNHVLDTGMRERDRWGDVFHTLFGLLGLAVCLAAILAVKRSAGVTLGIG